MRIGKVRDKYGHKHFGVKYQTKNGEKTLYYYEDGFKRVKTGSAKPEIDMIPKAYRNSKPTSLISRLKANQCEYCGATNVKIEVHHVKKLKDLKG